MNAKKRTALQCLDAIVEETARRLDLHDGAGWTAQGRLNRVCRRRGPHHGFWCLIHGHRKVILVEIPGAVGAYSGWRPQPLYLGADRRIYRRGNTKIYRAEIDKRHWPREILALANKIDTL